MDGQFRQTKIKRDWKMFGMCCLWRLLCIAWTERVRAGIKNAILQSNETANITGHVIRHEGIQREILEEWMTITEAEED